MFPPDHGSEDTTESRQTFTSLLIPTADTGRCDSPVVEVHDGLDGVPSPRCDVPFEAGEQRCDDVHAVLPPLPVDTQIKTDDSQTPDTFHNRRDVLVRSDDPFDDGVSDLVVDQLVVGTADEELVLRDKWERTSSFKNPSYSVLVSHLAAAVPLCRCSVCSWR